MVHMQKSSPWKNEGQSSIYFTSVSVPLHVPSKGLSQSGGWYCSLFRQLNLLFLHLKMISKKSICVRTRERSTSFKFFYYFLFHLFPQWKPRFSSCCTCFCPSLFCVKSVYPPTDSGPCGELCSDRALSCTSLARLCARPASSSTSVAWPPLRGHFNLPA